MTETNDNNEGIILEESELLLEVIRSIVCYPEKVTIEATHSKLTTILTITVDPSDRGQVIGREHKTLDAIEHLFTKAAFMEGRKVILQLEGHDPNFNRRDSKRYDSPRRYCGDEEPRRQQPLRKSLEIRPRSYREKSP